MKKSSGFWISLEKYGQRVIGRSPLPQFWPWLGVGLVVILLVGSGLGRKESLVGATSRSEAIKRAAKLGDYQTAAELLEQGREIKEDKVLGVESELEEIVYPEMIVWRRIEELEEKLEVYPGSKEIYLMLTSLYLQLGQLERADEYREKARILDPNGLEFQ